jgi:PAS domain S-box-containing protein
MNSPFTHSGVCHGCGAANSYRNLNCEHCRAPLPWAEALEAVAQEAQARGRVEGETKLRVVFDATRDGLIVCTHDGRVAELNRAMCEMHGLTREATIGGPVERFIMPGHEYTFHEAVKRITADQNFVYRETLRDQRADGSTFPIEVTASAMQFRGETHILGVIRDISATLCVEDELRSQLSITEAITENAADALFLMDAQGRTTYLNPAAQSTFGWTLDEMRGRVLHDVMHYQYPDGSPFPMDECPLGSVFLNGHTLREHEDVFWHRDGHAIAVSCSNAPIIRDGQVGGAVLVVHDISKRKRDEEMRRQVEEELQVTAERLQLATEATDTGTWDLNTLTGELTWSERCKEIFGVPPDTRVDFATFWKLLHPVDLQRVDAAVRRALDPNGNGEYDDEYRVVMPDGAARWVASRGRAQFEEVEGKRRVVRFIGTAIDINERKRAIDALHLLSAASATLSSSFDYATTLQRLVELAVPNYADFCIADLVDETDFSTTDVFVAHVEPAKAELMKELRALTSYDPKRSIGKSLVLRTGEPELRRQIDLEIYGKLDPKPRARDIFRTLGISSYMVLPLKVRGHVIGTLTFCLAQAGLSYNETDLKYAAELAERVAYAVDNARLFQNAEEARCSAESARRSAEAAQKIAEEANRAKDEFLATLSHELRTPLNAILGWASLLNGGDLDAETAKRAAEVIERNVRVQAQLLNDLFDVSRIITGKLSLEVKPMELLPVVKAAVDSVGSSTQAKSLHVEVLAGPQPLWVVGDPTRLQQVLWNLFSNAVRFTPPGGRIQVQLSRVGNEAQIEVQDSGQGIEPDFLPYVFDRFRQADSSSTRRHGGLGLGLAIVRHLVEMHGGTVHVESAGGGQGATFRVHLPLLANTMQNSENPSVPSPAFLETPQPSLQDVPPELLRGLHVLVVDDERDSGELVRDVLQRYGAQVQLLASAQGAIEMLNSSHFDVLISDIAMPDETGYDLLQKVRSGEISGQADGAAQIPAIALTALARPSDRHAALAAGFQEHLTKPVEPVTLAVTVASLTGRL